MKLLRTLIRGIVLLAVVAVLVVVAHLALIEIGREVVTLRTQRADGTWQSTRLWIVDDGGTPYLHSGGAAWRKRFDGDPVVELERDGQTRRYRAHALPGPHPRIDALLREKYGFADRWVRLVGPDDDGVVVVRLDPLRDEGNLAR
jgi:hypothetical protein